MGPRTSKRIVGAFVASLGAITLATEACMRAQVPLWAAVPALILAGLVAFGGTLLVMLAARVRLGRVRWIVPQRLRKVRGLYVGRARQMRYAG